MCVLCLGSVQMGGLRRCVCKGPDCRLPSPALAGQTITWIASTFLPDHNLALEAAVTMPIDLILDHFVVRREQEKGMHRWHAGDFSRAFGDRALS